MSTIESFLATNGPCLTSDVSDFLVQTHGVAPATARKRVSRAIEGANPAIMKLEGVTFPRKVRFIYLPQDFGSPYWRALENALLNSKSVLGLAIIALRDRDGIMPINPRSARGRTFSDMMESVCSSSMNNAIPRWSSASWQMS